MNPRALPFIPPSKPLTTMPEEVRPTQEEILAFVNSSPSPLPLHYGAFMMEYHGTTEHLTKYGPGGFHPVHLGDAIKYQYRVLAKLGSGGFGTVWLCRDTVNNRYVALKIDIARNFKPDYLPMECYLATLDQSISGSRYFDAPLDYFTIFGPNGKHQCIVSPVLGPEIAPDIWRYTEKDSRAFVLRDIARQAVEAMQFLHGNRIFHGDFRPSNILLKLRSFDHLPEAEVLRRLCQHDRRMFPVVDIASGGVPPAFLPRYIVEAVDIGQIGTEFLTPTISVIDFGVSGFVDASGRIVKKFQQWKHFTIPAPYQPPEILLLFNKRLRGEQLAHMPHLSHGTPRSADRWALACTIAEIRMQEYLFMGSKPKHVLYDMVNFFGKLPQPWWNEWSDRTSYFTEDGLIRAALPGAQGGDGLPLVDRRVRAKVTPAAGQPYPAAYSLEMALTGNDSPYCLQSPSRDEQRLLADFLRKMCHYDPSKRLRLSAALQHEWFLQ
jgi:serine/threonine-protein kinase SRPK3